MQLLTLYALFTSSISAHKVAITNGGLRRVYYAYIGGCYNQRDAATGAETNGKKFFLYRDSNCSRGRYYWYVGSENFNRFEYGSYKVIDENNNNHLSSPSYYRYYEYTDEGDDYYNSPSYYHYDEYKYDNGY
jgi:hypothetical protein